MTELINMCDDELRIASRKASVTKQQLVDVIVHMRQGNPDHDQMILKFTEIVENKINESLKPISEQVSNLIESHARIMKDYELIKGSVVHMRSEVEELKTVMLKEIDERIERSSNLIVTGIPEVQSNSLNDRIEHDKGQMA